MTSTLIQDLDNFALFLKKRRICRSKYDKIIEAIDKVKNAIEETGY